MLRRIELEVLATVQRGDTIFEIAMKLDHSESYLSRAVTDLVGNHVDEDDIRDQAVNEDEINALLRYLEIHGEVDDDQLSEWDKFQELAADYEVPLPHSWSPKNNPTGSAIRSGLFSRP